MLRLGYVCRGWLRHFGRVVGELYHAHYAAARHGCSSTSADRWVGPGCPACVAAGKLVHMSWLHMARHRQIRLGLAVLSIVARTSPTRADFSASGSWDSELLVAPASVMDPAAPWLPLFFCGGKPTMISAVMFAALIGSAVIVSTCILIAYICRTGYVSSPRCPKVLAEYCPGPRKCWVPCVDRAAHAARWYGGDREIDISTQSIAQPLPRNSRESATLD